MSNKSYPIKENSNVMKVQGGEQKVMKKILTVALSTAMAFSMFASVAFGDSATAVSAQDKFDSLKAKGIFNGYPDQQAHLEKDMTRAEFAKVITKLLGLKEVTGTLSYKDKGYDAKNWAVPYIEAVTAAGIMDGQDPVKKIFNYNGKVTVQEMATVLTRALKLEVPTTTDNSATEWAKGYVQAAIDKGLLSKDLNFQANASRELLVNTAYTIDELKNVSVKSYEVSDAGKTVTFTLNTGEVVKVTLDKALEANKETEVKYTAKDGVERVAKVTYVVTTATKVDKVSATNLKEVTVAFDGTVDEDTATDVTNYSLKSGKAIDSAKLSDDKKTVTLELVGTLNNNKTDAVTVSNIKAGSATVSGSNIEFSIIDNTLPEVSSVKSLGTKSVKVVFSEPVQLPAQSNFQLDGKAYFGKVAQVTNNTVILTPYNAALTVGDHKLAVSGVKDWAGFVALTSSHDITVVEDKDAPTVTSATATLESVTLTFSEEVDAETIDASNVYWMSGTTKYKASSVKALSDNKYKFTFSKTNALPTGAVLVYVEGVKDYSGNKIADKTTVTVNAEIDQTRPEVRKVEAIDSKTIQITASKTLDQTSVEDERNYTVTNKDGDVVSVKEATLVGKDKNIINLTLYTALSAGENTVTVKNIKDNTRLGNTMLDYSGKVTLGDTTNPKLDSTLVNTKTNTVVIGFDEKMDAATLADYSNYHVVINGTRTTLTPELADITVLNDSKAVQIKFAETFKGQKVVFSPDKTGAVKNINSLYVLGVKDVAGNLLSQFANSTSSTANKIDLDKDIDLGFGTYDGDYAGFPAALTAQDTVEVKLNASVVSAPESAFNVKYDGKSVEIKDVVLNGTSVVKLVLEDNLPVTSSNKLEVTVNFNAVDTLAGNFTAKGNVSTTNVLDKVAPTAIANTSSYKNLTQTAADEITVEFTEGVKLLGGLKESLAKDFTVVRDSDNKTLTANKDFVIKTVVANTVVIQLLDQPGRADETYYNVSFAGSKYLTDASTNVVNDAAKFSVTQTAKKYAATASDVKLAAAQKALDDAKAAQVIADKAASDAATAKTAADKAASDAAVAKTAADKAASDAVIAQAAANKAVAEDDGTDPVALAALKAEKAKADKAVTDTAAEKVITDKAATDTAAEKVKADKAATDTAAEKVKADKAVTDAQAALDELTKKN
ncbi:hypothetical protein J23TS9_38520 [Paenibacillus sp. J23TS9]|uniref:Ig-like domain-containing protein n=1 Tax=Paenibacillus sp. J23TS9 TaxID=2807193 RepID=UPI001B05E999|nr:Ig-like domain-containing protein [Paenibacillus sp. J23TS9]GIP28722.1 hypothetical protein J23TS9_38520 [Paenibacillus sp. J23TS9]